MVVTMLQLIKFVNTLDITWFISAMIHLLPVGFIAKLFILPTPRTGRQLNILTIGIIALTITATLFMQNTPQNYPMFFLYALITFVGWLLYLNWYSLLPQRTDEIIKKGKILPELFFEDISKSTISTETFLGKKTLYMFYRGNWCPLCMAQIKEIAAQYRKIEEQGVRIVLVSPQPHGYSQNLAKKFDVPFIFLADPQGKMAKEIGIFHKNGTPTGMEVLGYSSDTVLPTVVITDEGGEIIYVDQTDNYRVRPEPSTFLNVLTGLSVG